MYTLHMPILTTEAVVPYLEPKEMNATIPTVNPYIKAEEFSYNTRYIITVEVEV